MDSLKLEYAQFQEVEVFTKFGAQLEEATLQRIARGQRLREILKQPRLNPVPAAIQVAILFAANEGIFDDVDLDEVASLERAIVDEAPKRAEGLLGELAGGADLEGDVAGRLAEVLGEIKAAWKGEDSEQAEAG